MNIIAALDLTLTYLFSMILFAGLDQELILQAWQKEITGLGYIDPSSLRDKEFLKAAFCRGAFQHENFRLTRLGNCARKIDSEFW